MGASHNQNPIPSSARAAGTFSRWEKELTSIRGLRAFHRGAQHQATLVGGEVGAGMG